MSRLRRFLGLTDSSDDARETETVRRIAAHLESLEPERARTLAAFAYVLARVANADFRTDATEREAMEQQVASLGEIALAEAQLVVAFAYEHADRLGGSEHYRVTREFRDRSTREERAHLLECVYAVAAADGTISSSESGEAMAIALELGFRRSEANAVRAQWRDHLSELQELPRKA